MLLEPIARNAKDHPNEVAFIDPTGETRFGEYAAKVAGLGAMLRRATEAETVGVLLPTTTAFGVAFHAILAAGKTAVPINFMLGDEAIGHVIRDSGIDTVLSAPPLAAKLENVPGLNVIDLSQLPSDAPADASLETDIDGDRLATLLYTSGTSGLPKGVMLTHANLHETAARSVELSKLGSDNVFLGVVPLFHSTGLMVALLLPTYLGSRAVYVPRFSPAAMYEAIRDHGVTIAAAVPSMYATLARLKRAEPSDLKHLMPISGGEPLPARVREGFERRFGVTMLEGYGLTETCGPVAWNPPHAPRAGSVGKVLPGIESRVAEDGEVQFKGPTITTGYHHLDKGDAFTDDGYFRTGDLGRFDDDGYLYITGRLKDLIIVAGENLHPRELEERLTSHPAIAHAAVVGKRDDTRGEVPVAFVVAAEGQSVTADEATGHLTAMDLPKWMLPREVHVVDELPMSPTGKVLKRELAEKVNQQAAT